MNKAVDTNLLIYLFSEKSPWHKDALRLFQATRAGAANILGSELLLGEFLSYPGFNEQTSAMAFMDIKNLPLTMYPIDQTVLLQSAKIRRQNSISMPDAIHLATAITRGADYFVTNDKGLLKLPINGISIISLKNINRLTP